MGVECPMSTLGGGVLGREQWGPNCKLENHSGSSLDRRQKTCCGSGPWSQLFLFVEKLICYALHGRMICSRAVFVNLNSLSIYKHLGGLAQYEISFRTCLQIPGFSWLEVLPCFVSPHRPLVIQDKRMPESKTGQTQGA